MSAASSRASSWLAPSCAGRACCSAWPSVRATRSQCSVEASLLPGSRQPARPRRRRVLGRAARRRRIDRRELRCRAAAVEWRGAGGPGFDERNRRRRRVAFPAVDELRQALLQLLGVAAAGGEDALDAFLAARRRPVVAAAFHAADDSLDERRQRLGRIARFARLLAEGALVVLGRRLEALDGEATKRCLGDLRRRQLGLGERRRASQGHGDDPTRTSGLGRLPARLDARLARPRRS